MSPALRSSCCASSTAGGIFTPGWAKIEGALVDGRRGDGGAIGEKETELARLGLGDDEA